MTALARIEEILAEAGYPTNLIRQEGGIEGPLIVPFREDERGREMVLFIELLAGGEDDATTVVSFSLVYPYFMGDDTYLAELARLLFLLNRILPVGHHGFHEEAPAVTFNYNLLVKDVLTLEPEVILEAVDMIGLITSDHGETIDLILSGDLDTETVLDQMQAAGFELPPLFTRAMATG